MPIKKIEMAKIAQPYTSCKYYKSTGAPFGGCKHSEAHSACIWHSIDEFKWKKTSFKSKQLNKKKW